MGFKTLADFETDLQLALGNRGFTATQLQNWLNVGLLDLTGKHIFEEYKVSFAGNVAIGTDLLIQVAPDPITEPPLAGFLELSNDTDDLLITKISRARFNLLDPDETGPVQYWYRQGADIRMWPKAHVETLLLGDALQAPDRLVDPTDTTILEATWDRAVHLTSMFHALSDLEEPNRAVYFANTASRYISERTLLDETEGRATGMPVQPIESFEQLHRQRRSARTYLSD